MFEKILLPLDGSESAEVAVPYAEQLARAFDSEIVLLHAYGSEREPYRHMSQVYLDYVAGNLRRRMGKGPGPGGPRVRVENLPGVPADVICDYVQKNGIATIVMAAFGGSGVTKWPLGNVADKVIRVVDVSTVLVRAANVRLPGDRTRLISRILVPLDGSAISRAAVPYAVELASRFKARISLFGMAETAHYYATHVSFIPYSEQLAAEHRRMDEAAEASVRAYLGEVARELREKGVRATHTVSLGTTPAHEILDQEDRSGADFVVMATRGSGRVAGNRWAFGSVTEKVVRGGKLPIMLVR